MKVAQYPAAARLGNGAKRHGRPGRDDRNAWLLVSHAAQRLTALVDRPVPPSSRHRSKSERGGSLRRTGRDGQLFKSPNPVRQPPDTGLLSWSLRDKSSAPIRTP